MAISSLPPGFRFHPTDVELILYYLKRKVLGKRLAINAIPELDLYKFSPWDLPDKSCLRSRDLEWYFFCPKDRKYAQGVRTNRATDIGYWKATGRDRPICNDSQTVGMKKTLIFHLGRASQGKRTNWVMHEYRLEIKDWNDAGISQDLYVLCKIFEKSGAGPKNGEQHGAPFKEEEWEDDVMQNHLVALPIVDNDFPSIILDDGKSTAPENNTLILRETCESSLQPSFQNASSDASGENDFPSNNLDDGKSTAPGNSTLVLRETCKSSLQPSCQNASLDASGENNSLLDGVDMDSLLALLDEENDLFPIGNDGNEMPELLNYDCHVEVPHPADGNDIFAGLEDINTRTKLKGIDNLNFADMEDSYVLNQTLLGDDMAYMELDDFDCPMKYPVKGDVSKHNQLENFGGRLEIESGDSLGVRNSALSRENVSFKELDDLNFSKKYSLEVNSKNVPSGFAFLESVHPASGVGPSRRTLPSNSDVYSENVTVASNVGVGPSGFMFPKISDEHVVDDVGVVSTATVFGAGMSGCLLPKDSGVVPGNLELLQDQIDSGGASVGGGYKDAKQIPNVDLGEGERVNTNSSQTLARGKQHRAKSRLLCLLGSIPARPAAGAEFPYIIAGKGSKGSSLCANGCGSNIHVKAEVTVRCGCTEEALSGKLGEFPYLCCYPCGFLRTSELEKRAAAYSSRFTFVFLLGLIAALMWVFIISTIFIIGNWIVSKDDLISVRLLC